MSRLRRWKLPAVGRSPGAKLGEQQPFAPHPLVEDAVGRRIDDAEAVPEDADRGGAEIERREVRHGIEPARHAADDGQPGLRRGLDHEAAGVRAVGRMVPAADDGHRGPFEQIEPPEGEEDAGRLGNGREDGGIVRVAGEEAAAAVAFDLSRECVRPCATEVPLMAVAQAVEIPGREHKNSNGAARAP